MSIVLPSVLEVFIFGRKTKKRGKNKINESDNINKKDRRKIEVKIEESFSYGKLLAKHSSLIVVLSFIHDIWQKNKYGKNDQNIKL